MKVLSSGDFVYKILYVGFDVFVCQLFWNVKFLLFVNSLISFLVLTYSFMLYDDKKYLAWPGSGAHCGGLDTKSWPRWVR